MSPPFWTRGWVTLSFDAEQRHQLGRLLAYVWTKGHMVNALLAYHGHAEAMASPRALRQSRGLAAVTADAVLSRGRRAAVVRSGVAGFVTPGGRFVRQ
jgi:endonuclease YncB( thermonuclease family)